MSLPTLVNVTGAQRDALNFIVQAKARFGWDMDRLFIRSTIWGCDEPVARVVFNAQLLIEVITIHKRFSTAVPCSSTVELCDSSLLTLSYRQLHEADETHRPFSLGDFLLGLRAAGVQLVSLDFEVVESV